MFLVRYWGELLCTLLVPCWSAESDCANKSSATAAETCRLRPKPSPDIIIPARHYHPRIITPLIILQLFNKSWRAFHAGLGGLSFVGRRQPQMDGGTLSETANGPNSCCAYLRPQQYGA